MPARGWTKTFTEDERKVIAKLWDENATLKTIAKAVRTGSERISREVSNMGLDTPEALTRRRSVAAARSHGAKSQKYIATWRQLDAGQVETIRQMWTQEPYASAKEIGDAFGMYKDTVYELLDAHGWRTTAVTARRRKWEHAKRTKTKRARAIEKGLQESSEEEREQRRDYYKRVVQGKFGMRYFTSLPLDFRPYEVRRA